MSEFTVLCADPDGWIKMQLPILQILFGTMIEYEYYRNIKSVWFPKKAKELFLEYV